MKIGLIGIGFMGRGHLDQYLRLREEGSPIELTAIADVDANKFRGIFVKGNLDMGMNAYDFSKFACYTDAAEMIAREKLDAVDIVLPTYLHSKYAIMAMEAGLHVLCEKPMALDLAQCDSMIETARRTKRCLMIAQVLRFCEPYEVLRRYVESGEFGRPVFFDMFRGSGTPAWSYENWSKDEKRSGGCILDQHIHDVDMMNWLFGIPRAVSSVGRNVTPGAGYDAVSTHYRYDGFIASASDDWAMNAKDMAFYAFYRANFEGGTIIYDRGITTVYPLNADKFIACDDSKCDNGYYREIKYFAQQAQGGQGDRATLESVRGTIAMVRAEHRSCERMGEWVKVDEEA